MKNEFRSSGSPQGHIDAMLLATFALLGCTTAESRTLGPSPQTSFITVLGKDTVAAEQYARSDTRLEGDLMVRVPGTVHFHYVVERRADGTLARTVVDTRSPGLASIAEKRVTLELVGDSLRRTVDSAGTRRSETRPVPASVAAIFMTGFDDSYGLYNSLGMYELALSGRPWTQPDTLTLTAINPLSARTSTRVFVRRAPRDVDADFFRIAWTRLQLDSAGQVLSADATETTEKTVSRRVAALDFPRLVREFAKRDRDGKGLGIASPGAVASTTLDGKTVVVAYSSPRLRGRTALGAVVPYDQVWRTGANAATVLMTDTPLDIAGVKVPTGNYSLWTVPSRSGVQLVINRQHGQWGTSYAVAQDLARVPMRVDSVAKAREAFAITLDGSGDVRTLRIAWDRFEWSVPVRPGRS